MPVRRAALARDVPGDACITRSSAATTTSDDRSRTTRAVFTKKGISDKRKRCLLLLLLHFLDPRGVDDDRHSALGAVHQVTYC